MKVNIEALTKAIFKKWNSIFHSELQFYPDELVALIKHLEYSMKDITEYDELTPEEREIISPELFKEILIPKDRYNKELKEETRVKITQLLVDAQDEGLGTTDLKDIINQVNQDILTL